MHLSLGDYCWFMLYLILYLRYRLEKSLILFSAFKILCLHIVKYTCAKDKSRVILMGSNGIHLVSLYCFDLSELMELSFYVKLYYRCICKLLSYYLIMVI